jgi:thiamine-monophosphate kinase
MPGEFDLIRRFFMPRTTHTVLAGGDDAALIAPNPQMELAVSTDALVGGRHFFEHADAYGVGCKSMAVNLSDMAAMGASPRWATLALALPNMDEDWVERFARGFIDTAEQFGVDLIGGDTTRGPRLISVTIIGEVPPGKALRRSGACAGEDVWVSGTLGDAALALAHARGDLQLDPDALRFAQRRLDQPTPRVGLGQALLDCARGAIDVSDGLMADVGHIAEASRVRVVMHWDAIPLSPVAAAYRDHPLVRQSALAGGDDYELAFTAPVGHRKAIEQCAATAGVPVTRIGTVQAGSGVEVLDGAGQPVVLAEAGFDHFRST